MINAAKAILKGGRGSLFSYVAIHVDRCVLSLMDFDTISCLEIVDPL
jgi:hypothetical protein